MSKKDTKGKPKLGLIPYSALAEIAHVREFGVQKYGDDEAWYDVPTSDFLEAALRHIYKHLSGDQIDEESGRTHIAHAATSLILALAIDQEDRYFEKYVNDRSADIEAEKRRIDQVLDGIYNSEHDEGSFYYDEELEELVDISDYISEIEHNKKSIKDLKGCLERNDLTDHLKGETLEVDEKFEKERLDSLCACKKSCPTHLFNGA